MNGGGVARLRRVRTWDLLLVSRLLVWMLLVPVLKRLVPLPKVARLMWVDRRTGTPDRERQKRIVRAARLLLRARPLSRDETASIAASSSTAFYRWRGWIPGLCSACGVDVTVLRAMPG